jgi:hypothetical protein
LNGTWTLSVSDSAGGDTGAVTAANLTIATAAAPSGPTDVDFDGDGTTDYTVVRDTSGPFREGRLGAMSLNSIAAGKKAERMPSGKAELTGTPPAPGNTITWYTEQSTDGPTAAAFGDASTDFWTPADYDGDGSTDFAVWRSVAATGPGGGYFFIFRSSDSTLQTVDFGIEGDNPTVVGDYDGDGSADPAVFRQPAGGGQAFFYYKGSAGGGEITFVPWGNNTANTLRPYPGDFDGDGRNDFAVAQGSGGGQAQYVLLRSSDLGVEYIDWGLINDAVLAPGDYDGDGKTDFANIRLQGSDVVWYILERDGGGTGASGIFWGSVGIAGTSEFAATGDFDGDGATDIGIWRRNDSDSDDCYFYILRSSNGALQAFEWGASMDVPANAWNTN